MPIQTHWLIENRVVLSVYKGEVALEEAQVTLEELKAMLDVGEPPIYHISDLSEMEISVSNYQIGAVREALSVYRDTRIRWVVAIGANPITRFLASMFSQLVGYRMKLVADRETALAFLADVDETLTVEQLDAAWAEIKAP